MEKPSIIKCILSFLLRIVVVLALMVLVAVGSFEGVTYYLTGSFYDIRKAGKNQTAKTAKDQTADTEVDAETLSKSMKNTLFFVESSDNLNRYSGLIMMNKDTGAVDVLLIPLHVQVTVGGKLLTEIQQRIPNAGSTLQLDDIARVYGEEKYRIIVDVFSQIFGVDIAGYDVMSQKQFEDLLDKGGSISYNFTDLLSYRDSSGKLNYFQAGEQRVDGPDAMILMTHLDGTAKQESDRLERSNTYLEAWLDKAVDSGKGSDLVGEVQTNASSSQGRDFTEEKEVWGKLRSDAVTVRILQGAENQGLFNIDSQKAKLQVSTLIKQSAEYDSSGEQDTVGTLDDDYETAASSKEYFIELYNAAFRQGLASEWQTYLEEEGYNISLIDNYQEEGPLSTTRIVVSQEGMGQDLLKYFPGADIETGEIETGGDIQVYIGTDSTSVGTSDQSYESYDSEEDTESEEEDTESSTESETDEEEENDKEDEDKESGNSGGTNYYNFATDSE